MLELAMTANVQCPFCFETFPLELYPEDGETQELVYDCEVCCHPIEINATWNEDGQNFELDIQRSSGFD
jgi:hypothetical protein